MSATLLLGIVGGAIQAVGALQSANATARAAEYNAQVADRNRLIILQQADAEASDKILENKRRMSSIRAQYGAAGIDLAGSPLEVLQDSAIEGALDVSRTRYKGELRAIEQTDNAQLSRMEASNARTAGTISAVGSLFGGFSKGYGLQAA